MTRLFVTLAVEGPTDAAVVRRVVGQARLGVGDTFGLKGKQALDAQLKAYNNAAKYAHWLVLRDLDRDAPCAAELVSQLLPEPSEFMALRIVVRAIESWLLADPVTISKFLGVERVSIPLNPDDLQSPKQTLVNLARTSKKSAMRDDMVPAEGMSGTVGPAYTARIIEYANTYWRPEEAAKNSPSLSRCLSALARW